MGAYHPEITVRTAYDLKPCPTLDQLTPSSRVQDSTHVYNNLGDPHGGGSEQQLPEGHGLDVWCCCSSGRDRPTVLPANPAVYALPFGSG